MPSTSTPVIDEVDGDEGVGATADVGADTAERITVGDAVAAEEGDA